MINPGKELKKAIEAAKEAGKILLKGLEKNLEIEYKGDIDIVTDIDIESQQCILSILQDEFPDHNFVAEEDADLDLLNSDKVWLIDPLDGTTNYAHGYRCFCISIAYCEGGEIISGVIYDPCAEEMYIAEKGKGAFLNGKQIRVSYTDELNRSLLITGFPYDIRESSINNLGLFNHMIMKAQAVRRDGSAALDLAYLAAGRFDGFWELKLHPWDIAAGAIIVEEAGGTVSDFSGGKMGIDAFEVLATNGKIHSAIISELSAVPREKW
ncbi:MAG: inositol monophosphatase [bacterium]|nr:inositol monophosphatase [bacterium]